MDYHEFLPIFEIKWNGKVRSIQINIDKNRNLIPFRMGSTYSEAFLMKVCHDI